MERGRLRGNEAGPVMHGTRAAAIATTTYYSLMDECQSWVARWSWWSWSEEEGDRFSRRNTITETFSRMYKMALGLAPRAIVSQPECVAVSVKLVCKFVKLACLDCGKLLSHVIRRFLHSQVTTSRPAPPPVMLHGILGGGRLKRRRRCFARDERPTPPRGGFCLVHAPRGCCVSTVLRSMEDGGVY